MSIEEIATLANTTIDKVNKLDAFHIVQELIRCGDTPSDVQLANLYKYFLPPVPSKPKTLFQWVFKAVAVKDVRYYLNSAYSDGTYLVGTDGHRIHSAKLNLEEGYYDKSGTRVYVDHKFPDIERVVPKGNKEKDFDFKNIVIIYGEAYSLGEKVLFQDSKPKNFKFGLNKKYVLDAISFKDSNPRFFMGEIDEPIRIDFDNDCYAVIMPAKESIGSK